MPARRTCNCETCAKCKRRAYMNDWYRRNRDKACETARASRQRRIDVVREYDRERGFRVYDPEKIIARNAARIIPRQPCEVCGAEPADRHHDDYSRPTEVRFLCEYHHGIAHRQAA